MIDDLIYDVGMHKGEDTAFYLKKGFRVVAVEADPRHCAEAEQRFAEAIRHGRLIVVNRAIAASEGPLVFFRNVDVSVWGTAQASWAERNRRLGTRTEEIEVPGTTLSSLLRRYGVPYYLKIDIEGSDVLCLEALSESADRPRYVSIESNKVALAELRQEFDLLSRLGYRSFKIVAQHFITDQRPPNPTREGKFVEHVFPEGASGLFGEEAPGQWITSDQALRRYRSIFWRYRLVGDDPLIKNAWLRGFLETHGFPAGWYDTHARLGN